MTRIYVAAGVVLAVAVAGGILHFTEADPVATFVVSGAALGGVAWVIGIATESVGARFGPDQMYVANLLGAIEALDSGITTMLDWCHNINSPEAADAAVRGLRDSGQRTVFAYGNANDEWVPLPNDKPLSADARRVRSEHFSSDDQLTTMAVCLRGPQFSSG